MSGPPGGVGGSGPPAPRSSSNGPSLGLPMPPQHQANGAQLVGGGSGSGPNGNMSQQDLNSIVSDEFTSISYSSLPIAVFFSGIRCSAALFTIHFKYGTVKFTFSHVVLRGHGIHHYFLAVPSVMESGACQIPLMERSTCVSDLVDLESPMSSPAAALPAQR